VRFCAKRYADVTGERVGLVLGHNSVVRSVEDASAIQVCGLDVVVGGGVQDGNEWLLFQIVANRGVRDGSSNLPNLNWSFRGSTSVEFIDEWLQIDVRHQRRIKDLENDSGRTIANWAYETGMTIGPARKSTVCGVAPVDAVMFFHTEAVISMPS
jgi:hypothetical protein